jgi:hypothetical protein
MTFFLQLLEWIALGTFYLFCITLIALLCGGLLAPVGAIRWWTEAGTAVSAGIYNDTRAASFEAAPLHKHAPPFVVYLSGIGGIGGDYLSAMEQAYLRSLAVQLPNAVIIDNVFAFSVTNTGLTQGERFGSFWRWLHENRLQGRRNRTLSELINLRNALQLLVSADKRYGPIYNRGTASTIAHSLVQHGYPLGSGTPVTLISYSGGCQVALGSATYLRPTLNAPLQIISLAGVMNDDPGVDAVERMYHLYGERDGFSRVGKIVFPGRWERRQSRWNRALATGKIQSINMGPMTHCYAESYFDPTSFLPSGKSYLDHTVEITSRLITDFV